MSESSLAVAYAELRADVGHWLGYGRAPANWTARQADDVAATLRSGLRQFYNNGHDWSFLKPVATLTLGEGLNVVALPDDYAAAEGPVLVSTGGSSYVRSLPLGPWQPIYNLESQYPDSTGCPQFLCEEVVKGTQPQQGQRMRLHVYPLADADYTLTFAYRLNANALSANLPYAYGGAQHAQTLLQSCKAAAERDLDDVREDQGAQQVAYARMLEESKALDRRSKPHTVGANRDHSDRARRGQNYYPRPLLPISIDGVIYD